MAGSSTKRTPILQGALLSSDMRHRDRRASRHVLSRYRRTDEAFRRRFIRLIKMIIAPVIFCTVVTGIAGMSDMKMVGKAGGLALLYFEIVSTIALIIGLLIVNTVQPGVGMHVDPSTLDQSAVSAYAGPGKMQTTTQFLMNIIPVTVVGAFAEGEILQVLFFSLLFGFALHKFGGRGTLDFDVIEKAPSFCSRSSA